MINVSRETMLSPTGDFLTQGLFLEPTYDTRHAMYTFKDYDHTFKGKTYPSIKRLYLEMEDITEYDFANRYFYSWKHWKRILGNKILLRNIEEWREELEIKIRGQAVRNIIESTADNSQGSFQAAKWLADKGWDKRGAGRPSKAEKLKEDRIKDRVAEEYNGDIARMSDFKK